MKQKENDENSLISYLLDTFNIKSFLKNLLNTAFNRDEDNPQAPKFTDNFINVILFLIFLAFIFWQDGALKFQVDAVSITLAIILLVAVFELLGSNTGIFKKWFNNDEKTADYIKNLPEMTFGESLSQLSTLNFSNRRLGEFIESIKSRDTYDIQLLERMFKTQAISYGNINLLFTDDKLKNIDDTVMIRILYRYGNVLNHPQIESVYNVFKDNDKIIKLLMSKNKRCDELVKKHSVDAPILKEYYENFQVKKIWNDWILKALNIRLYQIDMFICIIITAAAFIFFSSPIVSSDFLAQPVRYQNTYDECHDSMLRHIYGCIFYNDIPSYETATNF